ncbi:SDR family NAD(P)-dependent oxidoreductase [Thauera sp.]|uniref:SDR family NAD(P)-dependent oxidoreductase n=1 Tax=Thauera sp. TaxID=1905334 RepID=UPI0039E6CFBE
MKQVVLITGAAQGLGHVIAQKFCAQGACVAVTDVDQAKAAEAAGSLDASGERVIALKLDVTRKQDFADALEAAVARFGHVTTLVNNAAMTPTTPVMEISAEEFDRVVAINQRGTFFGCQVFGQYFAGRKHGRIINMASLAGQNGGTASGAHYASSKGAILTLTKIFARQLAASGVTVNAVAPGPMDLPSVHAAVPADKLAAIINDMIPVRKLGDPAFVAELVLSLAAENAGFATGATFDVNGGIFMR